MKYFLLMFIGFINCNNQQIEKNPFWGHWRISCQKGSGFLDISKNDSVLMEVNSNQIYIKARGKLKSLGNEKSYEVYYVEADDLGRGGMLLAWDEFSSERMICKLTFDSNEKMQLEWYGFFNMNTKSYDWAKETDFLQFDNLNYPKCLEKCR